MAHPLVQKLIHHSLGRTLYKSTYRPKGVFDSLGEYLASDACGDDQGFLLYEAYQAPTRYRQVFGKDLSPYIEGDMKQEGHEVWIASVAQGRIDTDKGSSIAVFNRDNHLLGDLSFSFVKRPEGGYDHGPVRQNNIFTRPYLTRPKVVEGTVFSLLSGGGGNTNFYHWFVDVLSRLALLRESGWASEVDYFLVPNYSLPFQKESLALLGIEPGKIINGMVHPHVKADRMIVTSHPRTPTYHVPSFITSFLQEAFGYVDLSEVEELGEFPYLYITRGDAPKRKVVNEAEVVAALQEQGFVPFALSKYSLKEAIYLFKNARTVVAPHGAGLTNLLFCQPGTRVIEVFSDKFVNHYFYELATSLGLNYEFSIGMPLHNKEVKSRYEGIDEDVKVNIPDLLKKVTAG